MFITSVKSSGGLGGVGGADARCTSAGRGANKGGTWVAWLSTTTATALSRVTAPGPWFAEQSDGGLTRIFNDKANLSGFSLATITVDELGRFTSDDYWTGTDTAGGATPDNCSNWTDGITSFGTYGDGEGTSSWSASSANRCSYYFYALLCFEQSHQPLPTTSATQKRVFITSTLFTGDFGGQAAADAQCAAAAASASKAGTWVAWLSSGTSRAPTRLAEAGPWYTQKAAGELTLVFYNKDTMANSPVNPITVDERGSATNNDYWTGTSAGAATGVDCAGWTSTSGSGTIGNGNVATPGWTASASRPCGDAYALLCIEQ